MLSLNFITEVVIESALAQNFLQQHIPTYTYVALYKKTIDFNRLCRNLPCASRLEIPESDICKKYNMTLIGRLPDLEG